MKISLVFLILSWTLIEAEYVWKGNDWVFESESRDEEGSGRTYSKEEDNSPKGYDEDDASRGSGDYGVPRISDDEDDNDGYASGGGVEEEEERVIYNNGVNYNNENTYEHRPTTTRYDVDDDYDDRSDDITFEGPPSTHKPPRRDNNNPSVFVPKSKDKQTSFFAQPGILAAVVGGAVVGLLCAILFVMFIVYRMRKKDEGSYALDESKRSPTVHSYSKPPGREIYA